MLGHSELGDLGELVSAAIGEFALRKVKTNSV
jgi:hypothetical protein